MSDGDYNPWKVGKDEFQGYMKAKMESHDKEFKEIRIGNEERDKKISSLEKSRSKFTGALVAITFVWSVLVLLFNKFKGG